MSTYQSLLLGLRSSGPYFISSFLFGVMFGIAAASAGIEHWQAMLMSATVFSASAQFASLEFWQSPLPLGTIALSVALVSSRNILLGMSMTHHFDGHSMRRRIFWLFVLNDPGVVTSYRVDARVDRLGYVTGYGAAIMIGWLSATWLGLTVADWFAGANLGVLGFAGPLVMATMMVLFARGSKSSPVPWVVSGLAALLLYETGVANYLILIVSVVTGVVAALIHQRLKHA
ncbi:MAG: hypothetical protein GY784_07675 [Gammaproteobacteria bacterium]|nr:hypothetical protein [Gammaproteobacteria bacterium]